MIAKKIAIVLKPKSTALFSKLLPELTDWLLQNKKSIGFHQKEKERISKIFKNKKTDCFEFPDNKDFYSKNDLIISLGGDGTLIGICREIGAKKIPIFGVNIGHLGFIAEFQKKDLFLELDNYFKNKLNLTTLPVFKVEIIRNDAVVQKEFFVNDAVFAKRGISRIFTLSVKTEADHIYNLSGDGLIVCSPIGSTAYSLAAGGPVVHPEVHAIILNPICPHSLTHRPLVVNDHNTIDVSVPHKHDSVKVTMDGQVVIKLLNSDIVRIQKDKSKTATLIKNKDRTYFNTLKEKFTYGRG